MFGSVPFQIWDLEFEPFKNRPVNTIEVAIAFRFFVRAFWCGCGDLSDLDDCADVLDFCSFQRKYVAMYHNSILVIDGDYVGVWSRFLLEQVDIVRFYGKSYNDNYE